MSNYAGVRCPVCQKKFTSSDDIVVCPDCGAPHHRECYARLGECVFSADHLGGKEWHPPEAEALPREDSQGTQAPGVRHCASCGSANPNDTIFCQVCGANLNGKETKQESHTVGQMFYADFMGRMGEAQTVAEIPVRDMAEYVGPNAMYFLPRFLSFDKAGRHIMPNLSAFVFSFYYCFYRKMYAIGAVLLGVYLLNMAPLFLVAHEVGVESMLALVFGPPGQTYGAQVEFYLHWYNIIGTVNTVLRIGFFLLANHLYYNHVVDKIQRFTPDQGETDYHQFLQSAGGVDKKAAFMLVGVLFFAMSFLFARMMI